MAISVTKWGDAGAPTLNGVAGTLIAVLDHCLVTGAGWSKVFSGTNKAVYRAPAGNRRYLRVDDTIGGYARVVGYESMTDVDTGIGAFPLASQFAGGLYIVKSTSSGSAESRPWVCAATARGFVLWGQPSFTSDNQANAVAYGGATYFGDIKSVTPGDEFNTLLIAGTGTSYNSNAFASLYYTGVLSGHYIARAWHRLGGARQVGKNGDAAMGGSSGAMGYTNLFPFPMPADNGIYLSEVRINETSTIRGALPGVRAPMQSYQNFSHASDLPGSGALAGRTFLMLGHYQNGMIALEVSDTWDY